MVKPEPSARQSILMVAPQPFFQERGSPIAVRLMLETLCDQGYQIDLLTYREGRNVKIDGLTTYRIAPPGFVAHVPIGFSWQKMICDVWLSFKLLHLLHKKKYRIVHAVEEAVFPALMLKPLYGFYLTYDMDSSLSDQITAKFQLGDFANSLLKLFEKIAVCGSDAVVAVCEDLSRKVRAYAPQKPVSVLQDPPMTDPVGAVRFENLKEKLAIRGRIAMYIGNLEKYQGLDLLIQAAALLPPRQAVHFVIIGGEADQIDHYQAKAVAWGVKTRFHFIGKRPLAALSGYLAQADILVSLRVEGSNTPMKIYSYLAAGKPILATEVDSHCQVLDSSCAVLVQPNPSSIAKGLLELDNHADLRKRLGANGKRRVETRYSREQYEAKLLQFFAGILQRISVENRHCASRRQKSMRRLFRS